VRPRHSAWLVAGAALALVCSGCGEKGGKSSAAGAKVFASAGCGGCHTLAAAQSSGTIGPNLDQLNPDSATVIQQVTHGGAGMPSFRSRLSNSQIASVAAYVDKVANGKAPAFHPDKKTIAGCRGDFGCLQQAFGNIAYNRSPQQALSLLEAKSRSPGPILNDCHQIAHSIGHAALARYHGNTSAALGAGGMTCSSGYYHGIVEQALRGVPRDQVSKTVRHMCSGSISKSEFTLYQCVHGLGHGLMIYSYDDLPYSLHICDQLKTNWDQVSCSGGVFMQNVVTTMGLHSQWLRKNDLIYPCDTVSKKHKLYCYLLATSRILPAVGYNWRKTAAWCRRSERGWVKTCFQSYGRDASGNTQQDPRKTLALCRITGSMEGECLYGAARDFANDYANGTRASQLCKIAPARYRSYCFFGVGSILGTLNATSPSRRKACRTATTAYFRSCLRGAGA
jgi:mono/diheme cytochrome c family protein